MKFTLPLDKMTTEEKLLALEEIWQDLCRKSDNIPSYRISSFKNKN